jgi:16S rRNA (adenine1518-N6/adenine1519-N6)-dimethyltransferase
MKMRDGCLPTGSDMSRRRRSLGQHFLNSAKIAGRIANTVKIDGNTVVEIGSGKGILTRQLARRAARVIAVEIDGELTAYLRGLQLPGVVVLNRDFLNVDLGQWDMPTVIGNIPYSLTSAILDKLVEYKKDISRVVLTIQKEYGDRMLASVGGSAYGYITVYTNHHFFARKEFIIPSRFFSPEPKVGSVVLTLEPRKSSYDIEYEDRFFAFVEGIFRYRRKVLRNAILNHLKYLPDGIADDALRKRPQHLSVDDFHSIFQAVLRYDEKA